MSFKLNENFGRDVALLGLFQTPIRMFNELVMTNLVPRSRGMNRFNPIEHDYDLNFEKPILIFGVIILKAT